MEIDVEDLQKQLEASMVCSSVCPLVQIKRHIRYQAELEDTRKSLHHEQSVVTKLKDESTTAMAAVADAKVH